MKMNPPHLSPLKPSIQTQQPLLTDHNCGNYLAELF